MTIDDPLFLLNLSKNDMIPVKKLIMNLIKKMHKKYFITDENFEKIEKILHDLLSSLYISSEISYENISHQYTNLSIYKKHTGWAMNNMYTHIFSLIEHVSTDSTNHSKLESYLINDLKTYTNTCNNINLWNITKSIPSLELYSKFLIYIFPFVFVSKLIQNYSDHIDDIAYMKINEFIKKLIYCRNFRNDYKAYFESYLTKYDKYMTSFIIVYIKDENMTSDSDLLIIKNLLDEIHIKNNKIKVLEILDRYEIHEKINNRLKILQNEIVELAKCNFDFKYSFRQIKKFCIDDAVKYINKTN